MGGTKVISDLIKLSNSILDMVSNAAKIRKRKHDQEKRATIIDSPADEWLREFGGKDRRNKTTSTDDGINNN